MVYGRSGAPDKGVVVGLTPQGQRLMARVDPADAATMGLLLDLDRSPVGSRGAVAAGGDGLLQWRAA